MVSNLRHKYFNKYNTMAMLSGRNKENQYLALQDTEEKYQDLIDLKNKDINMTSKISQIEGDLQKLANKIQPLIGNGQKKIQNIVIDIQKNNVI